jgi:Na+/proline symporter
MTSSLPQLAPRVVTAAAKRRARMVLAGFFMCLFWFWFVVLC